MISVFILCLFLNKESVAESVDFLLTKRTENLMVQSRQKSLEKTSKPGGGKQGKKVHYEFKLQHASRIQ